MKYLEKLQRPENKRIAMWTIFICSAILFFAVACLTIALLIYQPEIAFNVFAVLSVLVLVLLMNEKIAFKLFARILQPFIERNLH